ncbi:hypothetical protein Scep_013509 [Stephania cephalantha]|uniref:Disease resistance protein RPM1-like n=1 Tax=Stephania cephalantha TaxID=152367 RepID=A0AAP0JIF2_9MAGN
MADGAVQFLVEKLTTLVVQKASLIGDSLDEFEEIKLEFEGMKAFLRDADSRKERDDGVGSWVRQVREVAHDVEDIIDEFMHLKENRNYHHQQRNGFNDLLYNVLHFPKKIISSHDIAVRLQKIKVKVHSVLEMGNRYGFDRIDDGRSLNDDAERWRLHRDNSIFLDEDEIVGMEEDREELLQWLKGAETRRRIVSIVGMGGLGKTTLVTKVFHDQVVNQQFDCCAWISVSQTYRIEELLRRMIEECFVPKQVLVPSNLGSMDYRQLVNVLIDYLHQKSYLIVLDDVWSIDLWSKVRVAFPNNKAGSRIILTTRNENVASSVGIGSRVHRLQPLLENNAWILFCHKAFWNNQDRTCPLELQCIVRKGL